MDHTSLRPSYIFVGIVTVGLLVLAVLACLFAK